MALDRLTKVTGPGISSDHNWVGNNANFTGVTTAGSSFNVGISTFHSTLAEVHNIKSTGIITATGGSFSGNVTAVDGTFTGNVSIAGTLTYEDVTNIDSVGIITAPAVDVDDFLDVGSNIKLGNAGVITATSYVGSGAALTGIDATAIKDSGGNVKVQAQASGAMYTGIHTFSSDLDVDGHTNLDNVSVAGVSTFSGNVHLLDSDNLYIGGSAGTTDGMQIYHNGNNSFLQNNNRPFYIGQNTTASEFPLYIHGGNEFHLKHYHSNGGQNSVIKSLRGGAFTLYHAAGNVPSADTIRLETTSTGINFPRDIDVDGHTNLDNVSIAGVTTTAGDLTVGSGGENSALGVRINSAYAQIKLPDGQTGANEKGTLFFGDGDDFTVVHDGYHNYVRSNNGWIIIKNSAGNNAVIIKGTNATEVYHATTKVLETSAKGIQVGTGVTVETNGQATYVGIVTASAFKLSDGSAVGGVESDSGNNTVAGSNAGNSSNWGTGARNNQIFGHYAGNSLTTGDRNSLFGQNAGRYITGGGNNTALGNDALSYQINGTENVAVGYFAANGNTGARNVVIGSEACTVSSAYSYSTYVGCYAGKSATGSYNVYLGYQAGQLSSGAEKSVAIGWKAKLSNTAANTVAIGAEALSASSSATNNTAVGYQAGMSNETGQQNTIIGYQALKSNTDSAYNVAIGYEVMETFDRADNGGQNTAVGWRAGLDMTDGRYNSCYGAAAGRALTSGEQNTIIGAFASAGSSALTGSLNTFVGYGAGKDSTTSGSNNTIIGCDAEASSSSVSNEVTIGDTNVTKFRIPGINVTLKDNGGTPTQGHVLTVDGSGEAGFAAIGAFVTGMIIIWSGAANAIPSGWVLCNGSNSTPDLRGRFIVGYHDGNGDYDVNDTGGAETVTLSTSQIPSHDHSFSGSGSSSHNHSFTVNNEYHQLFHPKQSMIARGENKSGVESYGTSSATVSLSISGTTNSAGSGGSHENRPPYYALCYIMKT